MQLGPVVGLPSAISQADVVTGNATRPVQQGPVVETVEEDDDDEEEEEEEMEDEEEMEEEVDNHNQLVVYNPVEDLQQRMEAVEDEVQDNKQDIAVLERRVIPYRHQATQMLEDGRDRRLQISDELRVGIKERNARERRGMDVPPPMEEDEKGAVVVYDKHQARRRGDPITRVLDRLDRDGPERKRNERLQTLNERRQDKRTKDARRRRGMDVLPGEEEDRLEEIERDMETLDDKVEDNKRDIARLEAIALMEKFKREPYSVDNARARATAYVAALGGEDTGKEEEDEEEVDNQEDVHDEDTLEEEVENDDGDAVQKIEEIQKDVKDVGSKVDGIKTGLIGRGRDDDILDLVEVQDNLQDASGKMDELTEILEEDGDGDTSQVQGIASDVITELEDASEKLEEVTEKHVESMKENDDRKRNNERRILDEKIAEEELKNQMQENDEDDGDISEEELDRDVRKRRRVEEEEDEQLLEFLEETAEDLRGAIDDTKDQFGLLADEVPDIDDEFSDIDENDHPDVVEEEQEDIGGGFNHRLYRLVGGGFNDPDDEVSLD